MELNNWVKRNIINLTWIKFFLNHHEYLIEKFLKEQVELMKPNSKILDAGAGECQYMNLFDNHKYLSQDLCIGDKDWDFSKIDIKSQLHKIPEKSNSFDYIILTQVLEHIPNPQEVMNELSRLLKNKGKMLLSVPQGCGEHQEPFDYFRYTSYGIKYLSKNAGLKLIKLKPQGGFFIKITQELKDVYSYLFGRSLFIKIIFLPYSIFITLVGIVLDPIDLEKKSTMGYLVVLEKEKHLESLA